MNSDLERFYELLARLRQKPHQGGRLGQYHGRNPWPRRGVYFFCEPGECRAGWKNADRVVRVGTHAVSIGSRSTLWGRLRAHRGAGGASGNHRGSVFRRHVGQALLARAEELHPTWGIGNNADRLTRDAEGALEARVSAYLGAMTVLWLNVPDEPGPTSNRAVIERNAIALMSNRLNPIDAPSDSWLGRFSPSDEIRASGLWNVDHVTRAYDAVFLALMEVAVRAS